MIDKEDLIRQLGKEFGQENIEGPAEARFKIEEYSENGRKYYRISDIKQNSTKYYEALEAGMLINALRSINSTESNSLIARIMQLIPYIYKDNTDIKKKKIISDLRDYSIKIMACDTRMLPFILESINTFLSKI